MSRRDFERWRQDERDQQPARPLLLSAARVRAAGG